LVILAIVVMSIISLAFVIVLFSHRIFSFTCKAFAAWPTIKDNLMRFHYDIVLLKGKQQKGWEAIFISVGAQVILAVDFIFQPRDASKYPVGLFYHFFTHRLCRHLPAFHRRPWFQGDQLGLFCFPWWGFPKRWPAA